MKRRKCRLGMNMVIAVIICTCILFFWVHTAERTARYTPDYPMEDISSYPEQEELTEEEYKQLYRQTGLTPLAIDSLRAENRTEEILAVQERFFAETEVRCERDFLLFNEVLVEPVDVSAGTTGIHMNKNESIMPALEDGDILITFNCHFLGWRNGHAAIVLDAEEGLTLEALSLGQDSAVLSVRSWSKRPSFAVLRLTDASQEVRAKVADYAEETLADIPYQLTAGIWGDDIAGTHCAHLIWYAYNQFGYNLDSDGGIIVTPRDLYDSPLLEVVQLYGIKPE